MRVDALRLEAGGLRELAQDQEGAGPCERTALGVEEQLGPVAPVQVRAPACQVTAKCLGRFAADRDDPLLAALAGAADEPLVEVDAGFVEADGLADAEAGSVEEL